MATTVYAVSVRRDLAKRGPGTRRRAGHEFSRAPLYFAAVPEAVEADPYLRVDEVSAKEWAKLGKEGARLTEPGASQPEASPTTSGATEPTPLSQLTGIDGLGPKTAEKLLAAKLQRADLVAATEDQLREAGLQDAQVKAVQDWQAQLTPEVREQLKAERIQ